MLSLLRRRNQRDVPNGGPARSDRDLVVAAIRDGACYGLDIAERAGIGAARAYPALHGLERDRVIESEREPGERPRRRRYRLAEPTP